MGLCRRFVLFMVLSFVFPDVASFVVNLLGRRDATFFLCGEVCRFISKLCARCYLPETIPLENSWFLLLNFNVSDGKFISKEEFLVRHRLTNRIATASKQCADVVHLNKKSEKAAIEKTAAETAVSSKKDCSLFSTWSSRSSTKPV